MKIAQIGIVFKCLKKLNMVKIRGHLFIPKHCSNNQKKIKVRVK
jgi:hypothetical protein